MENEEVKITFGGWYQRTSLHLTEIYDFLSKCESRLPLSKEKLKEFHKDLNLKFATKETGNLDFVMAETKSGIEIRYYEDGLYILEIKKTKNIESSVKLVKNYFKNFFNPAINYLFSLGAPTPKILSDIKEPHQIVITKFYEKHSEFDVPQKYGKVYSKTTSENVSVYKTPEYIFVVGARNEENLASIVEMQIFFREFKSQLHKYLGIHREIWEEISEINVLVEVANKSNVSGIKSIQILASIGVFVGIISYLTKDTLPKFSKIGLFYFLILIGAVILIDFLIKFFTKNKKYELKFPEKKRD